MIKNSTKKSVKRAEKPQAATMTRSSIKKTAKKADAKEEAVNVR
ncbi:hypothetical protein CHCC14525_2101 [Bacillus licheniformis]|nr:hypothetical protein CHCC15320_3092 [Bacillus licheniformis]TWM63385.1 hypothetical protein CHCC14810_2017 [Bacillus licheniformis]TWN42398.1 hypothetical protein CHCC14525_2101 [Bacillus licheniformis]